LPAILKDNEEAQQKDIVMCTARTRDLVTAALRGEPVPLEKVPVDLADRSDWDRLVLGAVRAIPRGETASYGEVARRIGRTGAARAVGGAVGRNPVGLLIPCHRVIAGDGSLGGYGVAAFGGRGAALAVKRELLALEGVGGNTPV
ncbi:MAG: MGMT family protein, partial [Calditerricola sp.]|nr:MGMT family protein [Calditerricola sp.]